MIVVNWVRSYVTRSDASFRGGRLQSCHWNGRCSRKKASWRPSSWVVILGTVHALGGCSSKESKNPGVLQ